MKIENSDRIMEMISNYHNAFENCDMILARVDKNALLSKYGIYVCPFKTSR